MARIRWQSRDGGNDGWGRVIWMESADYQSVERKMGAKDFAASNLMRLA